MFTRERERKSKEEREGCLSKKHETVNDASIIPKIQKVQNSTRGGHIILFSL